jgi:hypothetical protein
VPLSALQRYQYYYIVFIAFLSFGVGDWLTFVFLGTIGDGIAWRISQIIFIFYIHSIIIQNIHTGSYLRNHFSWYYHFSDVFAYIEPFCLEDKSWEENSVKSDRFFLFLFSIDIHWRTTSFEQFFIIYNRIIFFL